MTSAWAVPFTVVSWASATSAPTFCSDSSRSHGHSHPTVSHSAVGPMYAMGTPAHSHHQQASDGTTEKKKKKEERDREKHEKDKEKVGWSKLHSTVWLWNANKAAFCSFVTCLAVTRSSKLLSVTHVFFPSPSLRRRTRQPTRCSAKSTEST